MLPFFLLKKALLFSLNITTDKMVHFLICFIYPAKKMNLRYIPLGQR